MYSGCPRTFSDASESGERSEEEGVGLKGQGLFLVEEFGEVEKFVDLGFREGLDQLLEFFGGGHGV